MPVIRRCARWPEATTRSMISPPSSSPTGCAPFRRFFASTPPPPSSSPERVSELEIHVDVDHDRRGHVFEDDSALHRPDDHLLERPLALATAVVAGAVVDHLGRADPVDADDIE